MVLTWVRLPLLPVWVAIAPSLRLVRRRWTTERKNKAINLPNQTRCIKYS